MVIDQNSTPLPPVRHAPVQAVAATWDDLPANQRLELLRHPIQGDQRIEIDEVGGSLVDDVTVELTGTSRTQRGSQDTRTSIPTAGLADFATPVSGGVGATEQLTVGLRNRSATAYTQANGTPFRTYFAYSVTGLSVLEKLRYGIPLTDREVSLRDEFDLHHYDRMNVLPDHDEFYAPNLVGKAVLAEEASVERVDVDAGSSSLVFDHDVAADEVLYVTGLRVNAEDYSFGQGLQLEWTRAGTNQFYTLDTHAVPGLDYELPLHIPAFTDLSIEATANQALTDVTVHVETARVRRTLLEKALHNRDNGVKSDDQYASARADVYETFKRLLAAGVPITDNIDVAMRSADALPNSEQTQVAASLR